ncbi:MAG: hypothetical protein ACSHWY_04040, partial [Octadecabacter sp.]
MRPETSIPRRTANVAHLSRNSTRSSANAITKSRKPKQRQTLAPAPIIPHNFRIVRENIMVDIATRVWNHKWKIDPIVR